MIYLTLKKKEKAAAEVKPSRSENLATAFVALLLSFFIVIFIGLLIILLGSHFTGSFD